MSFDSIDRKLLNLVQAKFPLTEEPYADLGQRLEITGDAVIQRIKQLKIDGVIRQISPVVDAGSLGYRTTLVAMKVTESQLNEAARLIGEHPRVSHCYQRDHSFNLWFTLAVPPDSSLETELEQLTGPIDAEAAFALPAVKLFKIGAYFDMDDDGQATATARYSIGFTPQVELSQEDKLVINELQQDLPLVAAPFSSMAARLNMDVEALLDRCQSLLQRGVMRRFGAAINHKRAGFKANAMACWIAPAELVDAAGRKLASLPEVSHCYERKTNPLWQYNLYAMIHGHSQRDCQETVNKVSCETGLTNNVLLFSTREFKKVRNNYLV